MPVEIRELVIKVNIVDGFKKSDSFDAKDILELKKQIIKECTEKVITNLEKRSER